MTQGKDQIISSRRNPVRILPGSHDSHIHPDMVCYRHNPSTGNYHPACDPVHSIPCSLHLYSREDMAGYCYYPNTGSRLAVPRY